MTQSFQIIQENAAIYVGVKARAEKVVLDDGGIVEKLRPRPGLIPGRSVVFGHIGAVPAIHCATGPGGAQIASNGTFNWILGDAVDISSHFI